MLERTFSLIKPNATQDNLEGAILADIQQAGFTLKALKKINLTKSQAEGFYAVHKERPFFGELVDFMVSGPVVCSILEKENAIADYRTLMGATDPSKADEGTLRKKFAKSLQENSVHGSDSAQSAAFEMSYFFNAFELI